ncbi:MAG: 30S ribosomal protein S7 [Promethearchaeota archaeon]
MSEKPDLLLFGEWSSEGIEIKDPGLEKYISLRGTYVPLSCGRHERRRFRKSNVHIIERLANRLMSPGTNTGKKYKILKSVYLALKIIEKRTDGNPLQVIVDAIVNAAPREETTRISYGGIVYHSAVDAAPQRRVDISLRLIAEAIRRQSFNNLQTMSEILADELIATAQNNARSYAIRRKQDIERVALSAR